MGIAAKIHVDKIEERGGGTKRYYVTWKTIYYRHVYEPFLRWNLPYSYDFTNCPEIEAGKDYIVLRFDWEEFTPMQCTS
ncbi:hypothetical protein Y032_0017g3233 [Ancylostoma ceylanicum]|uniref:Uncharacterized protein n=1 Tax=Ancylostoma ceylanicum TaxID=53326 RepID=A0A016V681_9BILA|nr:hypothetical protein Y032_0017g3233 [Ancylostoma ceylanicum]